MSVEKDFEPSVAAQMQAELLRFAGKCHYDEEKKENHLPYPQVLPRGLSDTTEGGNGTPQMA